MASTTEQNRQNAIAFYDLMHTAAGHGYAAIVLASDRQGLFDRQRRGGVVALRCAALRRSREPTKILAPLTTSYSSAHNSWRTGHLCGRLSAASSCRYLNVRQHKMGHEYSKSERKLLRDLAGEVYEWELHGHLEQLDKAFAEWRRGEMFSSELSDKIHHFHQNAARELWSMYQSLKEDHIVARGVVLGVRSRKPA